TNLQQYCGEALFPKFWYYARGNCARRPSRSAAAISSRSATVRRCDWRAPLTGKELYLNGLNSGRMPSHAALAKAGSNAGSAANPAKRAKLVMPIIGEIRI